MGSLRIGKGRAKFDYRVVGYQTYELKSGFNMFSPSFVDINGGEKVSIQALKMVGSSGAGLDTIQMLNQNGGVSATYYWLTYEGAWVEDGWYTQTTGFSYNESDKQYLANVELSSGNGLYIYVGNGNQNAKIQTCGNVKLVEDTTITLPNGFSMIGNPIPCDISIQDIKLVGSSGAGLDTIQMLNQNGGVSATYYWLTYEGAWVEDGWYTQTTGFSYDESDKQYKATLTINSGDGLYINKSPSSGATVKVVLPSVSSLSL